MYEKGGLSQKKNDTKLVACNTGAEGNWTDAQEGIMGTITINGVNLG